ncbi:phosphonate metabolism transcriptional regulator PhnF [uncultured Enterovirga sp.]|uniref:phosphonate metabolism transcriptional regulator PhnF n=1 Tax=uncultured Enterovirga sp. TaxID=2026352 RepID=UPI0035CB5FEF
MDGIDDKGMTGERADAVLVARRLGVSVWRQIADTLEAEIASGRLPPGAQLETEAVLADRFSVNRHTVRRALAALAERGIVRATRGRGTFVEARPLTYPLGSRVRFSEIVAGAGHEAWGELVSEREIAAGPSLGRALGLPEDGPLLELATIHRADDTPISVARTCLPLPRFAGFGQVYAECGSITRAYAAFAVADYVRLTTRISARIATAEEALALDLASGRVVLVVESVNVDAEGCRIQATRSCFAADRVEFLVES